MTGILSLCNPGDEDINLRQPSTSEPLGNDLRSGRKQSWAKGSTCKQAFIMSPI
jgi:hypothetical protein